MPLRVTVIDGTGRSPLEASLAARGFDVSLLPRALVGALDPGEDVVVGIASAADLDPRTLPVGPIRVLVAAGVPSLGHWDLTLVPGMADPAASLAASLERWLQATRVGIRIAPRSIRTAGAWGDTYFGADLRDAFRGIGWPARVHLRSEWDDDAVGRSDVVIDVLGVAVATTWPGTARILWQISHPELAALELYTRYDRVFVASDGFAARMAAQVDVPVAPLLQATDPHRFRPAPGGPAHDLLVVAGWREDRHVVDDVLPTDYELAVYGRGWVPDHLDPRHHRGDYVPNDELASYYAAASIVLNDHAAPMRADGFLSNRLFDAAASGAFVITDDIAGLEEFDGGVVGYRDRDHLRGLIDRYLADPDARRDHAERARAAVLARHTFEQRARVIAEAVRPLLDHGVV